MFPGARSMIRKNIQNQNNQLKLNVTRRRHDEAILKKHNSCEPSMKKARTTDKENQCHVRNTIGSSGSFLMPLMIPNAKKITKIRLNDTKDVVR